LRKVLSYGFCEALIVFPSPSLAPLPLSYGLGGVWPPLWNRGEGSRSETGGSLAQVNHPPASLRSASPLFHRGDKASGSIIEYWVHR
jgi:hypothetical protein